MSTPFAFSQNLLPIDLNLADLLELHRKEIFLNFNAHHLGTITSFQANTDNSTIPPKIGQTATATINYTKTFFEKDSSGVYNPVSVSYPPVTDCPVIVLGGGSCSLTFPIQAGDECLILFNDRDMDNWFVENQKSMPNSYRLHAFNDAIILVGLRNATKVLANYSTTHAVLQNGTTQVGVGSSSIKIANALYTLNGLLQELLIEIQAITVTCPGGGGTSSTPLNAAAIATTATHIGELLE